MYSVYYHINKLNLDLGMNIQLHKHINTELSYMINQSPFVAVPLVPLSYKTGIFQLLNTSYIIDNG